MDFDLKQLRFFVAIADAGGFSRAAHYLGIAQSALSHHIAQMESRLGVSLFARTSKGVALTESGRRLYDHGQRILAAVETASDDVRGDPGEAIGLVRIGITLSVIPELIGPLMSRLEVEAPRVSLRVIDRLSPQLVRAVSENEIDIAVCFNAENDLQIEATPLFEEPVCLVGVPSMIGEADKPITLEEALSFPLLLPGRDHTLRGMVDRVALLRNRPLDVRHECFSFHAVHAGLENGIAASLISKFSALSLWKRGKVVCRPLADPQVTRKLFVARRAKSPTTSAIDVVIRVAEDTIQDRVMRQDWPDTTLL